MWRILAFFMLAACSGIRTAPVFTGMEYTVMPAGDYNLAIWQKITDPDAPVHVYIEGDGRAFNAYGRPTSDPTPRTSVAIDLAARDTSPNVAYIARPCQYVQSAACNVSDWTDGRFSAAVIDSMANAVRTVADGRDIVLIGHSGGALVSGLIITHNPDLPVRKWITVAGVLNHADWTEYFGDAPLSSSLNLDVLPHISATHYIAAHDTVVPQQLSVRWVGADALIIVPNTKHNKFPELNLSGI